MDDVVGEQGTYWVTNSFTWGWLLLPIIQLGELVKRDVSENESNDTGFVTLEKETIMHKYLIQKV